MVIPEPSRGEWKILIETKLLSEAEVQEFALVITAAQGTNILEPRNASTLPENILEQCYPGSPLNPETDNGSTVKSLVEVSIFNFWSSLTSIVPSGVTISPTSDPSSQSPSTSIDPIFTLDEHHQVYEAGRFFCLAVLIFLFSLHISVCLSEGCFVAELNWERNPLSLARIHDAMGIISELPICEIFLSPYLPSQEFCIDKVSFFLAFTSQLMLPSVPQRQANPYLPLFNVVLFVNETIILRSLSP